MAVFDFDPIARGDRMWPRATELPRVQAYTDFDRLYDGDHRRQESDNRIPVHWYRRVSEVFAEMLFASPPTLRYEGGGRVSEWIESLYETLMQVCFDAAVDVSRYGTGVMRTEAYEGRLLFAAERPAFYTPVVDASNIERRLGDIFGYPYNPEPKAAGDMVTRLRLVIHRYDDGSVTVQDWDYDGAVLGQRKSSEVIVAEGASYPRVVQIPNGRSENGWGESDYIPMTPLIAEMEQRLQGIGSVLDRHTDPHIAMPETSITVDDKGNADLNTGSGGAVIPVGEGESPPVYVTWDARLEANYEQIQWCQDLLFAVTGLSAAMFSGRKNLGTIESGVALRSRYLATHLKLEGLRRRFERGLRTLLEAASRETQRADMESVAFDPRSLRFEWQDIFPADAPEDAARRRGPAGSDPTDGGAAGGGAA